MVEVRTVSEENIKDLYRVCIPPREEYAGAVKESSDFFLGKTDRGWRGLVAYEEREPVGRVEFYPLEESFAGISGEELYFMPCVQIAEEHQGKGYGRALMGEVLRETSDRKGLVTITCQGWMPKAFFQKLGFEPVEQTGPCHLMLRKHTRDARAEILASSFTPKNEENKVNIDVIMSCQCPYMTVNYNSLLQKAKELSDDIEVTQYLLTNRGDLEKYGEMNLYVDGEAPFVGPGREEEIERLLRGHLRRKGLTS